MVDFSGSKPAQFSTQNMSQIKEKKKKKRLFFSNMLKVTTQ